MDSIVACSDCGTPLVASEREAIEGIEDLRPARGGPYRAPTAKASRADIGEAPRARNPAQNDKLVGSLFFFGGILLMLLTGALSSSPSSDGKFVLPWGPILYGLVRLGRGYLWAPSEAPMTRKAPKPRSLEPRRRRGKSTQAS